MQFRELANAFARLEAAGGRLAAVRILTTLFTRATPAELERVVYLLQGQLRPAYEGVEFGIAERLLVRALGRAFGCSEELVRRQLARRGDLGLVAEALGDPARRTRLTVGQVYRRLSGVAGARGAGAVERRIALLAELLRRCAPIEARYLVRIVQGRLRLGVGDATVIEAAAVGALGDRRRKDAVERAYNVRSDLGGVVRLAYARGARGLAGIVPRVGVPIRPALAQRLPSAEAIVTRLHKVQAEPKYDGFRLQLHRNGARVWAFSRRLENVTEMFPELTAALPRQLRVRTAILEGEAVVHDPGAAGVLRWHDPSRARGRRGETPRRTLSGGRSGVRLGQAQTLLPVQAARYGGCCADRLPLGPRQAGRAGRRLIPRGGL